jgi:hypothetical protein
VVLFGTTVTVGPSASNAFSNSVASLSVLSTLTARQPKPISRDATAVRTFFTAIKTRVAVTCPVTAQAPCCNGLIELGGV